MTLSVTPSSGTVTRQKAAYLEAECHGQHEAITVIDVFPNEIDAARTEASSRGLGLEPLPKKIIKGPLLR